MLVGAPVKAIWGPLLVAVGASLWATDAIFRVPTVQKLHPAWITFFEHAIVLGVLAPWAFFKRSTVSSLRPTAWIAALLIGSGGSAIATVLFTASFRYVNPSVSILLQKLQPIITTIAALLVLGERPGKWFYLCAPVALSAGVIVSFPDFDFSFLSDGLDPQSIGVIYAASAAGLWGLCTVAGKVLLSGTPVWVATFWRFAFGFLTLSGFLLASSTPIDAVSLMDISTLQALAYMALVPGFLGVFIYYSGLSHTKAQIATFAELVFPVSAVAINTFVLDLPLSMIQLAAGAILLGAVTMMSVKTR